MSYLGNAPARSFISFERQVFTIVNSQTAYTLSHSVTNENDIRLVVNNVVQEPGSGKAYTATGTTLTLSAALTNGTDEMYCVFLGRAVGTVNAPAGSVGTSQLIDLNVTSGKIADDAITLAKMAPGTDGNIISYDASGNPVAVATGSAGQILTSAGAGAPPTFATAAAAGITNAQQWRITTSFTGSATPISANWEEADTDGYGRLGDTMASVSGIFTFPSTGYWHITSTMTFISNSGGGAVGLQYGMNKLQTTTDNSSYNDAAGTYGSARVDGYYITTSGNFLFDVTDTSTHKVRLSVALSDSNATVMGDSNMNRTYLTFVRLGDT